jgi:AcrR family transcriptional regulator
MTVDGAPRRPLRADARRNYERLLAAGEEAFTRDGPDASLEDIARRAGVGIGTLYRHFPTRIALLEAVYLDRIEALAARAEELAAGDPAEALTEWLRAFAEHNVRYRGLKGVLVAAMQDGDSLSSVHTRLRETGGALLARAQQAGVVRPDLTISELFRLSHGIVVACEIGTGGPPVDRLLSLLLDGIRS